MSFGKQDQLLQKLQRCVGKLQTKTINTQRYAQREVQKYNIDQYPKRQKVDKSYTSYQIGQSSHAKRANQVKKQNKENYERAKRYDVSNQGNNFPKQYLTERKVYNNQDRNQRIKQYKKAIDSGEVRNKYADSQGLCSNSTKNYNRYLQNNQSIRKPLREADGNYSHNLLGRQNNITSVHKQVSKFQRQAKNYPNQEQQLILPDRNLTSRYEVIKRPESSSKFDQHRRNSISHNSSYNQGIVRSQKLDSSYLRNIQLSNKVPRQEARIRPNTGQINGVQPFTNLGQIVNSKREEQKTNIYASHEIIPRIKSRNMTIGVISSLGQRQGQKIEKSYQSFGHTEVKQSKQLNLKKILDEVGNANQDTFTKLKKITELNQRINQRIKNIIQTFQSK